MLRETGLLDESVVALYGDHQAWLDDTADLAHVVGYAPGDRYQEWKHRKQLPLIIRLPRGAAAGVRTSVAGHLDIAPTLLALAGIQTGGLVMFGRDVTADEPGLVVFRDGSFADEKNVFMNRFGPIEGCECHDADTEAITDCRLLTRQREQAARRLRASDSILVGNLVESLRESDTTRRTAGDAVAGTRDLQR
jgi:phosphoglycerol transferase MdoB-like AlkP superfamily enzyme